MPDRRRADASRGWRPRRRATTARCGASVVSCNWRLSCYRLSYEQASAGACLVRGTAPDLAEVVQVDFRRAPAGGSVEGPAASRRRGRQREDRRRVRGRGEHRSRLAKASDVSPATVQRIWSGRGLKPHLVKTFKLSNDPRFEEKLIDVVGLHLNPPEQAVVLCMDEKSSVQALDRTQPSLPMKKGRAGTMTHDYKRNGTTTLFAALNVLTGVVIGQCLPRHRHEEFLKFLRRVDRRPPPAWP